MLNLKISSSLYRHLANGFTPVYACISAGVVTVVFIGDPFPFVDETAGHILLPFEVIGTITEPFTVDPITYDITANGTLRLYLVLVCFQQ